MLRKGISLAVHVVREQLHTELTIRLHTLHLPRERLVYGPPGMNNQLARNSRHHWKRQNWSPSDRGQKINAIIGFLQFASPLTQFS